MTPAVLEAIAEMFAEIVDAATEGVATLDAIREREAAEHAALMATLRGVA